MGLKVNVNINDILILWGYEFRIRILFNTDYIFNLLAIASFVTILSQIVQS